jgi:hypothetical protein
MTLGLVFVFKAATLVGIARIFEIPEPIFSRSLEQLWGGLLIASSLIGYYSLAYAFMKQRLWAIPVAIFLNAMLFAQEIRTFIFPWMVSRQQVFALVQEIAIRGDYILSDQVHEEILSAAFQLIQPGTLLDLAGRASLVILLFIIYRNRPYLATVLR